VISNRPNVYLAGPLFSVSEKRWNCTLRDMLCDCCDVYLPQEDGALLVDLIASGMAIDAAKELIFQTDIAAIDRCDILLLTMDGRTIDEGACFELGFAYSRSKICVGLKTDVRSLLPIGDNPMIACALQTVFSDIEDARRWIQRRQWDRS